MPWSRESDVSTCLAKSWTDIGRFSIIEKTNLFDEITRDYFQDVAELILQY